MAQAPRPLRAEDIYRLASVSDPQISPDGSRIACVISRPDREKDTVHSDIWLIESKSGRRSQLTNRTHKDSAPRWSPDGSRVAFVAPGTAEESAKPQIWVIDAGGGEARRLTNMKQGASAPAWSPDGRTIAFLARDPRPEDTADPNAPKLSERDGRTFATDVTVVDDIRYRSLAVLPRMERRHIYRVPASGGRVRRLTTGEFDDADPQWSPDGASIAFVSRRDRDPDWENESDIYLLAVSDGAVRRVSTLPGGASSPAWSPDGTQLAFVGSAQQRLSSLESRLYVQPLDGKTAGKALCLTSSLDALCSSPRWAPDGQSLFFLAPEEGYTSLRKADLAGVITRVLPKERCLGDYSVARDAGTVAFLHSTPEHPADLFTCNSDGRRERRLTAENRSLLAQRHLATTKSFWCDSFDGTRVHGWIMRPTGFRKDRRYPLVLMVHGGPYAHYAHDWHLDAQVLAAHGFMVVYANPRGSTGYGDRFLRAAVSKWGQGDARDCLAAVDYAIAQGSVDPARVGVVGQSFGGFMTLWLLATTDRFTAGVSRCGVSDQRLYYFTSDMPRWREQEFGGPPWERCAAFRNASPSTHLHKATAPLLLLHAEDDTRVPITQSELAFVTLKRRGVPTRLVRYPSGNHGFASSCPRFTCDTLNRTLEWFEQHLTGRSRR